MTTQAAVNDRISKGHCGNYTSLMNPTWTTFRAAEIYLIREKALQPREGPSSLTAKGELTIDSYVGTQDEIGQS